jgi:TonB family protein
MVWIESWRKERPQHKEVIEIVLTEPKKPAIDQVEDKKQIVEQNKKAVNDEVPKDAKYMSQNNQKVVEETKAANRGSFANAGRQNLEERKAKKVKPRKPSPEKSDKGLPTLEALKPSFDWEKLGATAQPRDTASQSDDYLKDVKTGVQTMLSTREFLYYSYYNRIKSQLKQYWEPKVKDKVKKIFQQGRTIASDQDRITKVIIHLDNQGILVKVQVVGASGVSDLDEAAVEAFRAAAPFPNPPKGIVDQDGTIKIRWDFVLESADASIPDIRQTEV